MMGSLKSLLGLIKKQTHYDVEKTERSSEELAHTKNRQMKVTDRLNELDARTEAELYFAQQRLRRRN